MGKAGNDVLQGLGGDDTLIGGLGNDQFDGGEGFDIVSYHQAAGNVVVNLRSGQFLGAAAGDTFISIEGLRGTRSGDSLVTGDGNNRLFGEEGDDFLDGGNGNDRLFGGAGADFLHGGAGRDTAVYTKSDAGISVTLDTGPNTGGHAEGDVLSLIENVIGSTFGDRIEGNLLKNTLSGRAGDDVLIGRAGSDKLTGGAGAEERIEDRKSVV